MKDILHRLTDAEAQRIHATHQKTGFVRFDTNPTKSAQDMIPHLESGHAIHFVKDDANGNPMDSTVGLIDPEAIKNAHINTSRALALGIGAYSIEDNLAGIATRLTSHALGEGCSGVAFSRPPKAVTEQGIA